MKYFIIDFDSTFVKCEMLEELAKISLQNNPKKKEILKQITSICQLGMEGKIPFQESLRRRLQLIKVNKSNIKELVPGLKKQITPSILKNCQFFQKNKKEIYIISGAFKECITPLTRLFQIEDNHVLANTFSYDKSGNITGVDLSNPLAFKYGKIISIAGLRLPGTIYVLGDGYTDFEIKKFGVADYFVAFAENVRREQVMKKADFIANNFDEFLQYVKIHLYR